MIGQIELQRQLNELIDTGKFPQFAIFLGEEGSGKKTLMRELTKRWPAHYILEDVKVDTIRQMIAEAYKCASKIVYVIPDAHRMSPQARASILKIVEEPPKSATFLMSVSYEPSLLDTIRSRGTIFRMNRYTQADFQMYLQRTGARVENEFMLSIVNTIADIQKCLKIDPDAFYKHICTVLDKADTLTEANLLKSSNLLAFKDEEDKPDVKLFFQAVEVELYNRIKTRADPAIVKMWADILVDADKKLAEIQNPSINRRYAYEAWLLDIRALKRRYMDGHR